MESLSSCVRRTSSSCVIGTSAAQARVTVEKNVTSASFMRPRLKDEWSLRDKRHRRQSRDGSDERAREASEFQLRIRKRKEQSVREDSREWHWETDRTLHRSIWSCIREFPRTNALIVARSTSELGERRGTNGLGSYSIYHVRSCITG